ncbi:hypothetical protein VTN49DRAFT_4645 [Thermomyces lanuginosus]|uniref:uncharacterized protein n=1 Tax=Thermomyces lanuginosus TaxID=5541 RepID=UPI0037430667
MASSQEPLKILSLDGGGVRGLSGLLILENIMEKIRERNGLDRVPRPCEQFDLIGGTGTGGIIAIMLGRLQMTIDDCIKEYREFARQAFTPKSWPKSASTATLESTFSAKRLEGAIKSMIRKFCPEEECKSRRKRNLSTTQTCPHENMRFRDKTCTKTVVLATTKVDIDARPTLLTTFKCSADLEKCAIWEVARATSAVVGFFKSIKLGRDKIEYVAAAFGYNNPCELLIEKAREWFPEHRQMRILSIGTGLGDVITIRDTPSSLIKALKEMATSSRIVARRLEDRFADDRQYFRFNVDQGLRDITASDWESASRISAHTRNYLAENERAIMKFVDSLSSNATTDGDEDKSVTDRIHFAVPFGRNRNFVGREQTIAQLLAAVPPSLDADDCQKTAIVGLVGVGKTQIALEIAFRVREKYSDCSIFWVPAIDAVSFRNAYRNIGQLLGIDGISDDDADVGELVKETLSRESVGSWLLVIDNADSLDLFDGSTNLARYLPFSRQGSLLFTSRNRELIARLGVSDLNVFIVEGMSENEAFKFLERHLTNRLMNNRDDTAKLLDVLGYLPLAIRQASAYMATKQISTTKYLELCQSKDEYMVELLSRDFEDHHRYREAQDPIATTWLISFRQINDHDQLAADYLKFMCFLSEKAIPRSLLPQVSALEAEDAIGTLKAYAYITEREKSDTYDIHRLVRLAMLNWLKKQGELEAWAAKVIRRLNDVFPLPEHDNREIWAAYLPHAQHVLESPGAEDDVKFTLFSKVGRSFQILGQYREAEIMHTRALDGQEKMLGPDHPDTLHSVSNLGNTFCIQGQYEKAEELHRRALKGREEVLGPDHIHTLYSVLNLGNVFINQGQYERAEAMYQRAQDGFQKKLGPSHPDTLTSIMNLGNALHRQGRYEKAEAMHRRALEGQEKTEGQHEMAEAMYRRALEGQEKVLGPNHPETLVSAIYLGSFLYSQGKYEKAEALYRRALEGYEKVFGPDHPHTLHSVLGLGNALSCQGQYEMAEAMYRRALEGHEKTLGPDNPDTLISAMNLGSVLHNQGKYERAEEMYRRALEGQEKVLGPDHSHTLHSVMGLSNALQCQGQYERAMPLRQRAMEGRKEIYDRATPATVNSFDTHLFKRSLRLFPVGRHPWKPRGVRKGRSNV